MRYLLDTHVFLWLISSPQKISEETKAILENGDNLLLLSAISGLEISIKYQIGRLNLPDQPTDYIKKIMNEYAIEELAVKMAHSSFVNKLPDIHKDPFDRLLIAQSMIEKLPLITYDKIIKKYPEVDIICQYLDFWLYFFNYISQSPPNRGSFTGFRLPILLKDGNKQGKWKVSANCPR